MLDFNIVIVNWKMAKEIGRCLSTLKEDMAGSRLSYKIHIIDNYHNQDGTKEMIAQNHPEAVYHDPGVNLGFGRGQNLGFSLAEANYYVPLNPDIEFIPGSRTLDRIHEFMAANARAGIVGPKLLNIDGSLQYSCCRFPRPLDQLARRLKLDTRFRYFRKRIDRYLMRDFDHQRNARVDWVLGSFQVVRKAVAEQIGFYDERYFMYFEDCDWCRRAWRAGWEVYYLADTAVKHGHRRESADLSPLLAPFKNPVARMHLISWAKYFLKWGIREEHFGI